MPTKLLPKNNIPEYQLGGLISNIGLSLYNLSNSLFGTYKQPQQKTKNLNYDPQLKKLQQQLYNIGAFKNVSKEKAVDGLPGNLTNNAIRVAKSMGYTIENNKLIEPTNGGFLDGIKNAWKKLTGTYVPTLEEFKEQKRQELRNKAARVNSQTITPNFPQLGRSPMQGHDMDIFGKKKWSVEKTRKEFSKYSKQAKQYLLDNPNIEPLAKKRIQEAIKYYDKVVQDPNYITKNGGGFGCIYTASGAYGDNMRYTNNRQLANDILAGKDTGYEIVDDDNYKVGDIIQLGKSTNKSYPHHAEMVIDTFMGYPKLAQTQAEGYGPKDKETSGISAWNNFLGMQIASLGRHDNGKLNQGLQVIRFVGTKKQNKEWEKEYHKLYG